MYLVTSLTNWQVNESLATALETPYRNRIHDTAELFIVSNNIVKTFGQLSVNVKEEYADDLFAIKLIVKETYISYSIKSKYLEFIDNLYDLNYTVIADAMPELTQQVIEVYAISNTESKLLTTFSAHPSDMSNIEFEIDNCQEALDILSLGKN
jgi:hypothetical protein